jgi:hypothetical protein
VPFYIETGGDASVRIAVADCAGCERSPFALNRLRERSLTGNLGRDLECLKLADSALIIGRPATSPRPGLPAAQFGFSSVAISAGP